MINFSYADFAWEQTEALLAVDSPSGYTDKAAAWVKQAFENLGFSAHITTKGGVIADLGGADENEADQPGRYEPQQCRSRECPDLYP